MQVQTHSILMQMLVRWLAQFMTPVYFARDSCGWFNGYDRMKKEKKEAGVDHAHDQVDAKKENKAYAIYRETST